MRFSRIALAAAACVASTPVRAEDAPKPQRKLLVYTLSAGYKHGCIPTLEESLVKLGRDTGAFEATVSKNPADFNESNLKAYDAVFFYTTRNVLPESGQRKALFDFVKSGKGFAGSHCATDTLYDDKDGENCPEYGEMVGGYFDGHPWHQEVKINVEDATHPATKGVPSPWNVADEIYQFRTFSRDRVHVLLSLDTASVDVSKGKRADKDYAIAWCRTYGQGRVFYTALGHRKELWQDDTFLKKHILPGLQWSLGDIAWQQKGAPAETK